MDNSLFDHLDCVCFIIRYFSADKAKSWDLVVPLDSLNLPRKYGFLTSLMSFGDFFGNVDCDISRDSVNLGLWPNCYVYLSIGDFLYVVCRGKASWGHHGEPEGYLWY